MMTSRVLLAVAFLTSCITSSIAVSVPEVDQNATRATSPTGSNIVCGNPNPNLNPFSCWNAAAKIQPSVNPIIYAPRSRSGIRDTVIVPIRYLSDDGHCAVDVALKHGIRGDVSSGFAVARATGRVFQQCLAAARDGYTSGFTPEGGLIVSFTEYAANIVCDPPPETLPLPFEACSDALNRMPTSKARRAFFNPPASVAQGIELPRVYWSYARWQNPCEIRVSMPEGASPTRAFHIDFWYAAIAVVDICVRAGKTTGRVNGLGDNKQLVVSVSRLQPRVDVARAI